MKAALVVSFVTLAVGACAFLDEGTPNVCPSAAILDDAGELVRFSTIPPKGAGDVSFRTKIKYISGVCDVADNSIEMELNTAMEVVRGPANAKGEAEFAYFVAILDANKKVLTRTKFPMIARFKSRETTLEFSEAVTVTIPKKATALPKDYIVYLGFEMTPDELAYNRKKQMIR